MGTKAKEWLEGPDEIRWLFKQVRQRPTPEGLRTFGEDWSEKLAAAVAALLRVPTARIELAERHGKRGVLSRTVLPTGDHALVHGNELLQQFDRAYDKYQIREARGYTLDAVWAALEGHGAPEGSPEQVTTASAAFAGYLLLDAVIANTDRHHENWAVIQPPSGRAWLAPSFDHATCLGFQVSDDERTLRLDGKDEARTMAKWVARGRSSHFEGRPPLVDLVAEAMARVPREVAEGWRRSLEQLDQHRWGEAIAAVPDHLMSQPSRRFADEIIRLNRARLLDGWLG